MLPFLHPLNGGDNVTYPTGLLEESNEFISGKSLYYHLAYSKCLKNRINFQGSSVDFSMEYGAAALSSQMVGLEST
jgi:hypothetical protein